MDNDLPVITLVPNTWTASNGVVLKLKKVSRFVLMEMGRKIVMPKVPTTMNEEKGREEENPLDPDYLTAVQDVQYQRSMMIITASFALGTEIQTLPDGMPGPDDDEWLETLTALDIEVPTNNKRLRYSAWLKYVALDDESFQELLNIILKFSGLPTEANVTQAQETFPSKTTWALDPESENHTEVQSTDNYTGQ